MKAKYTKIPRSLRSANTEYKKLYRLGQPVSTELRIKQQEYRKLVNKYREEDILNEIVERLDRVESTVNSLLFYLRDDGGKRAKYKNIPKVLRSANNEYKTAKRQGKPVSKKLVGLVSEYQRWVKNGGVKPTQ